MTDRLLYWCKIGDVQEGHGWPMTEQRPRTAKEIMAPSSGSGQDVTSERTETIPQRPPEPSPDRDPGQEIAWELNSSLQEITWINSEECRAFYLAEWRPYIGALPWWKRWLYKLRYW